MIAADVPSGRGRDDRRGRGAGGALRGDRDVPPAEGRAVDRGRARSTRARSRSIDIGIPRGGPARPEAGLIGAGVLREVPRRSAASTKFSSGNVFIIGGSRGLTGAPCMSALAAMRAGAGYVTVGAPASLELSFTVRLLEAMVVGLPEDGDGHLDASGVEQVLKAVGRADAVVLGPGLSKDPDAQALARAVAPRIDVPLVIDADGLNALAGQLEEIVAQRRWPTVLTPHAGELGRLLEVDSKEVERSRLRHVREAAAISQGVRGAQGRRHARGGAVGAGGDLARARARAGDRRHGRRALRRDRRDAGEGDAGRRRARARASTRTCGRGRSPRRRTGPTA